MDEEKIVVRFSREEIVTLQWIIAGAEADELFHMLEKSVILDIVVELDTALRTQVRNAETMAVVPTASTS